MTSLSVFLVKIQFLRHLASDTVRLKTCLVAIITSTNFTGDSCIVKDVAAPSAGGNQPSQEALLLNEEPS